MKNALKEVLKELDWSDGFRIPVANEENKQLEKEIEEKSKKNAELASKLRIATSRVEAIEDHLKHIQIERDHNQNLLSAYVSQHNAEENLHKISEHEAAAIKQQIRNIEKEKKSTEDRIKMMEAEISKLEKKIESSKSAVAFDESKCLQWEETLDSEEERLQLIQNYLKADGKKFKELDLKRQKLTEEVARNNEIITKIMEEITEQEIALDRTSKFYSQVLEERRNLIDRWTQSIVVLRQRDSAIQSIIREIESLNEIVAEKERLLNETEEFTEHQENCNKDLKNDIAKAEKRLALLKEKRSRISSDNEILEMEHKIRKQSLNEINSKTEALQGEIKGLEESIIRKRECMNDCNKRIYDLEKTLDNLNDDGITMDERLKEVYSMLAKEEKRKRTILKATNKFQNLIHQANTKIVDLKNEQKIIEIRKQGAFREMELHTITKAKYEKLLEEKNQVIDKLDLQIHNYEMQIADRPEEIDQTELEQQKRTIKELEDVLNEKRGVSKLLQSQISSVESEVKKLQTSLNKSQRELETVKDKHSNLSFVMETNEKALKHALKANEEKQVELNIMELRVTKVEEVLRNTDSKVHNLEQMNVQIHAAMQERMAEIKTLREALNVKQRLLANECTQLRAAITEKQTQTKNCQIRYEAVIAASQLSETDHAAALSTLELKIQNARDKSLLQERGDKLDMTIRKTEQEIKSMENTLRVVSACNENYKMSLSTDDYNDESSQQMLMQQLAEELLNAREELKKKKKLYTEKEKTLLVAEENHETVLNQLDQTREEKENKVRDITALQKQIADQRERIARADMRLKKLYKDIQKKCECANAETILLQEKDIKTRELAEINLLGLQRITEFTVRHVEAEMYVKKLLAAKNIVLPGIQHFKSTLSLGTCDGSTTSSVASFSSRSRGKLSKKQ